MTDDDAADPLLEIYQQSQNAGQLSGQLMQEVERALKFALELR